MITLAFMPPYLLEEEDELARGQETYSGKAAELAVQSWLTFNSRKCAVPTVDRDGVDLLVDGGLRAQVKKVVFRRPNSFNFRWQRSNSGRKYGATEIDIFFHVIQTSLRTVIFETPSHVVPTTNTGLFVIGTEINLVTDFYQRKQPHYNPREYCVYQSYNPKLYQIRSELP